MSIPLAGNQAAPPLQQTDSADALKDPEDHVAALGRSRLLYLACAALVLLLLVVLPPLISVNHFQRRIAASISASLGRPVHLDKVVLNLLPLPGFTLQNFVVDEDPAFGMEPVIRANSVRATLRISSLWSRRVEFSTISFTEPSVNLVHTSTGKWNLDSILLHAAHIDAAPTDQRRGGPAPRFPYIEATGARLNLKLDNVKTSISLTDADFALWLPDLQDWHLRLQAHPARTDTDASGTGSLQVEGTLGRAASLEEVPVNLRGEWRNAPLGAATLIVLGRDVGLRGNLSLSANVEGTVGHSGIQATLKVSEGRRADFVPEQTIDVDIQCVGTASSAFYSFQNIRCSWPPAGSSNALMLEANGALPDIRNPGAVEVQLGTPGLPAGTLLDWLRVASSRVPPDVSASGTLTGNLSYQATPNQAVAKGGGLSSSASSNAQALSSQAHGRWQGRILLAGAGLINPAGGVKSLVAGDVDLHSVAPSPVPAGSIGGLAASPLPGADEFVLAPAELVLGGKDPALLEGRFDAKGYNLHLTGMASTTRLKAFATAIPPLSDGLAEVLPTNRAAGPFRVDLTATRVWGKPQIWTDTLSPRPANSRQHRPGRP